MPPSPPEDILPSLDDEEDADSSIDDGKFCFGLKLAHFVAVRKRVFRVEWSGLCVVDSQKLKNCSAC